MIRILPIIPYYIMRQNQLILCYLTNIDTMTFDGEELNTKYLLFYAFRLINIQLIKK